MEILVIGVLILLNGFFALSEIALVSLKKQRIEHKAQRGDKRAKIVLELLKNPEGFLSSIQVGITLIGVVSGVYGGATLVEDLAPALIKLGLSAAYAHEVAYIIIIVVITYFSIVVGELIPKVISMRSPEKIALAVAPVVKYFSLVTYPFVKALSAPVGLFTRLFNVVAGGEEKITEDEIQFMIKTASSQGVIEKAESELHQNVFMFTSQKVKNLMTHRSKVEWLNINDPLEEIEKNIKQSTHSRFPVCDDDVNNVVGVLAVKDLFEAMDKPGFTLKQVLSPPLFVPETMYTIDVLQLFKKNKTYTAFIIDEYGSVEGMITMQDLIETIVGDLPETDTDNTPDVVKRNEHSWLVNGTINIKELNAYFQKVVVDEDEAHYQTLAGFILYQLGHIPQTGEKLRFFDYLFEVVDKDGNRIDKILVSTQKEE